MRAILAGRELYGARRPGGDRGRRATSRGDMLLHLEIVGIDTLDVIDPDRGYTYLVINHQTHQLWSVYQDDPFLNVLDVGVRLPGEA